MFVMKHRTGRAALQADIDAAQEAIAVAEEELRTMVGEISTAPRSAKTTVSAAVHGALTQLRAAKARLLDLEKSLELAQRKAARAAVGKAEEHLDAVIGDMGGVEEPGTTWTTKVVTDAFTKLTAARATLADLDPDAEDDD